MCVSLNHLWSIQSERGGATGERTNIAIEEQESKPVRMIASSLASLRDHSCIADLLNFQQSARLLFVHLSGARRPEIIRGR